MRLFIFVFFSVYALMHLYLLSKINCAFKVSILSNSILTVFLVFMVVSPYIVRILEKTNVIFLKAFAFLSYSWLGFIFLIVCLFLFYDLFSLILKFAHIELSSRSVFTVILTIVIIALFYGYFEAGYIKVEKIKIKSYKLRSTVQIALISDLHIGILTNKKYIERICKILRELNPQIIISSGDLIDSQIDNIQEHLEKLKDIRAKYGKYAVTGNHEYYAGITQAKEYIRKAGFDLLQDDSILIEDLNIKISGINDSASKYYSKIQANEIDILKKDFNKKYFVIFVKHRPVVNRGSEDYFDLQLSGHTHKGQIFPFNLLVKLVYHFYSGFYKTGDRAYLYISRGTGTWGPPMRIFARPEITLIELNGKIS